MNRNLCTLQDALVLGKGGCDPEIGFVTSLILSKNKMKISGDTDIKKAIQDALNDNSAVMLEGMHERTSANEAAVTGTFADGFTVELRPPQIVDNFIFHKGLCSTKAAANLVGFKGYAFAVISRMEQFAGFETSNSDETEMFPISITSMDVPNGVWGDEANRPEFSLSIRSGDLNRFVKKLKMVSIDFTETDLVQPYELGIYGTVESLKVVEKCSQTPVTADVDELTVEDATVNGAPATGTIAAGTAGTYVVTLTTVPKSGDVVSLKIKWATDETTNGLSSQYTYIMA